jgi:hypothetical protein
LKSDPQPEGQARFALGSFRCREVSSAWECAVNRKNVEEDRKNVEEKIKALLHTENIKRS